VRLCAVLVGLANATAFALGAVKSLDEAFLYFLGDWPSWSLAALYALSAVMAGLLRSKVVLRFVRRGLQGDFYTRHLTMVLAVCVGGMLLGALLVSASALTDGAMPMTDRVVRALIIAPIAGFIGGWLGFAEGLILGFPLGAALGLFAERG
jgi:hypothetical protein